MIGITEIIVISLLAIFLLMQSRPTIIINHGDKKEKDVDKEINQKEMQKFGEGVNHVWRIVQLCIFKMYKENSIIDFEGYLEPLSKEVDFLLKNPGEFQKWDTEFNKYVTERNKP
jgi:hypothetical protein